MALTNLSAASTGTKKKFERIEDGTYVARIAQLIDLGVQEDEYEGERKVGHKIFVTFEFPTETINIDGEEKPRWLGKEFNVSIHEKSTLTKLVQSADPEGKFTVKGRNLKGLMGLPLMITVGSTKTGNAKVSTVARLMKGMSVAELAKDPVFFDLDGKDLDTFEIFPQWIKDKITNSIDFEDTLFSKVLLKKEVHASPSGAVEDMEDDRPY